MLPQDSAGVLVAVVVGSSYKSTAMWKCILRLGTLSGMRLSGMRLLFEGTQLWLHRFRRGMWKLGWCGDSRTFPERLELRIRGCEYSSAVT